MVSAVMDEGPDWGYCVNMCVQAELDKNKSLMEGIKSVMQPDVKERFEAQEVERQRQSRGKA